MYIGEIMIKNIFLIHHTHTDIGYTDIQTSVFNDHIRFLDNVLEYCDRTDRYPEYAKFRWTCEVIWQVEHYFKNRPERIREFIKRVKQNRIEITGLYLNLTDLFSLEMLIRSLYPCMELKKRYGIDIITGMNCDINGLSWAIPQLLNSTGIKYLLMATDEIRSFAPSVKRPFWWIGPDNKSKLLVWNAGRKLWYAEGIHLGFTDSYRKVKDLLPDYLVEVEKEYPYDTICLQIAMDNEPPVLKICDIVKKWNEKEKKPFLIISTPSQFFQYMEKKYKRDSFPSYKLAWPDWWADGTGSCAFETSLCLENSRKIVENEAIYTILNFMNKKVVYPFKKIEEIYQNLFFFGEHTFGASSSINEPFSSQALGQWAIKSGYIYRADIENKKINEKGKGMLSKEIPIKENKGEYRKISQGYIIENNFYKIEIDKTTGCIKSIFDKEIGEEINDGESMYGFNQYIYENIISTKGRDAIWEENSELPLWSPERKKRDAAFTHYTSEIVSVDIFEKGEEKKISVIASGKGCKNILSEIILYPSKLIEIKNTLFKETVLEPEGIYFAFPFKFRNPEVRLCGPGKTIFQPCKEQLPSTAMDWYSVENFVILSDWKKSVIWVSMDAPLVQFSQINTGRWLKYLPIENGTILSYVMNNYWYTNFRPFQEGIVSFRYFITSLKGKVKNSFAFHFSQKYTQPFYYHLINRFVKVNRDDVLVISLKKAEDKRGYIIRMKETDGKETVVNLTLSFSVQDVFLTDIGENNLKVIHRKGDIITIFLHPFEIVTLRIIPSKKQGAKDE